MSSSNDDIQEIFKGRTILLNIYEKYGYDVSIYKDFTQEQIYQMKQHSQLDMVLTNHTTGMNIHVKHYLDKQVKKADLAGTGGLIEILKNSTTNFDEFVKYNRICIITVSEPNPTLCKDLCAIWENRYSAGLLISVIGIKKIQYNITEHILVPKYRIMTESEIDTLSSKLNLTRSQFKTISRFDPPVALICLAPDEIVDGKYTSQTAGVEENYRRCVNIPLPH